MPDNLDEPATQPALDLDLAKADSLDAETGRLHGGRCTSCSALSIPRNFLCYACESDTIEPALLPPVGNLYSYTTIHVSPSFPTPYTVGYVDLDCGIRVLGHVLISQEALACDVAVVGRASELSATGWAFELAREGISNE